MEQQVLRHLAKEDVRAVAVYTGQLFTQTEPYFGDHYSQVLVGLNPKMPGNRSVAGLCSLAPELGGHSLIWGPVAASVVSGLLFSTLLTLFAIPLLYRSFMPYSWRIKSLRRKNRWGLVKRSLREG